MADTRLREWRRAAFEKIESVKISNRDFFSETREKSKNGLARGLLTGRG